MEILAVMFIAIGLFGMLAWFAIMGAAWALHVLAGWSMMTQEQGWAVVILLSITFITMTTAVLGVAVWQNAKGK